MKIITAISLLLVSVHLGRSFLIGAFNIKSFGDSKASNATLLDIITKVVHRYDIVLIQEVRDSDLTATNKLMQSVNGGSSPYEYQYIVSEPLGRSTYKERYLFIYRSQTVSVAKSFQYDDGCESCGTDTFNREPFVVMFSSNTAVREFALIPQHTSPEVAVKEIDALHDVVLDTRQRLNTNVTMLLICVNSKCRFRTSFTPGSSLIVIVATSDMMKGVSAGSAQVFDFMQDHGLSQSWALAVSDHFPVEVKLL
uniref:Deoxyribonuclease-1-like n=1 Tax=Sinocyclocheilus anshuiensis TaxID=1608454 RepID=A0A671PC27_9TELE